MKRIVLDDIRRQAEHIRLDEDCMLHGLREKLIAEYAVDRSDTHAERRELKQELHTIDLQIEQLYDDKVSGVITAELFTQMVGKTDARRQEIENRLTLLEQTEAEAKTKLGDIQLWILLIKENIVYMVWGPNTEEQTKIFIKREIAKAAENL